METPEANEAVPAAPVENLELTVMVQRDVFEKALENPALWQHLWNELIFQKFVGASLDLKGYVANGFKPIENPDEARAAKKKIADLDRPLPKLIIPGKRSNKRMTLN